MSQTEDVLNHHLQSFGGGDVDELVSDYTEDSVILFESNLITGLDNIRAFFDFKTMSISYLYNYAFKIIFA